MLAGNCIILCLFFNYRNFISRIEYNHRNSNNYRINNDLNQRKNSPNYYSINLHNLKKKFRLGIIQIRNA
jgi:hypothetical protein